MPALVVCCRATQSPLVRFPSVDLTPHPGGLPGRVADAQAEAEEALAAGDIDGAIGADMLAAALTDAALNAGN